MSQGASPHEPATIAAVDPARFRVVFVSDRRRASPELQDEFNVIVLPFSRVEAELATLPCDVLLVDVVDTARLSEVSRLALGGTRAVVVLGAPRMPEDAMRYLDVGAYDYVASNAAQAELIARLRAVARSAGGREHDDTIVFGSIAISFRRREVRKHGQPVRLTPNEFAVLEQLARAYGELVSHREIMANVWGPEFADARHYLRLYIRQLREKIEDDPASPSLILTARGAGYRLEGPVTDVDRRATSA